jgi:predicted dehydrogenase
MPRIVQAEQQFEKADPLMAEVLSFLDAVRDGTEPPVTGQDGQRALEVALEICRQMNLALSAVTGVAEESL